MIGDIEEASDLKSTLERKIEESTRGTVNVRGNTKWGFWFPKVTSVKVNIDFTDVLLKDGSATVKISY